MRTPFRAFRRSADDGDDLPAVTVKRAGGAEGVALDTDDFPAVAQVAVGVVVAAGQVFAAALHALDEVVEVGGLAGGGSSSHNIVPFCRLSAASRLSGLLPL